MTGKTTITKQFSLCLALSISVFYWISKQHLYSKPKNSWCQWGQKKWVGGRWVAKWGNPPCCSLRSWLPSCSWEVSIWVSHSANWFWKEKLKKVELLDRCPTHQSVNASEQMPLISCFQLVFTRLSTEWQEVFVISFMGLDSSKTALPLNNETQYFVLPLILLPLSVTINFHELLSSVAAMKFYWTPTMCKDIRWEFSSLKKWSKNLSQGA